MIRASLILGLCLTLVACGTPQERCIRTATKDLRTVDTLITEVEGNLARGYAIETRQMEYSRFVPCPMPPRPPRPPAGSDAPPPPPPMRICEEDYTVTTQHAVAIDLAAEQRKLDSLKAKRIELNRQAAAQIAQCKQDFPEEPKA